MSDDHKPTAPPVADPAYPCTCHVKETCVVHGTPPDPTQTPPQAGHDAPLGDVMQAFADVEDYSDGLDYLPSQQALLGSLEKIRTYIASITAERDALLAGQIQFACGHWEERYEGKAFASCGVCRAIKRADRETKQRATARIEALEWAKDRLPSLAAWPTGKLIHALFDAEIARLKSQMEKTK